MLTDGIISKLLVDIQVMGLARFKALGEVESGLGG